MERTCTIKAGIFAMVLFPVFFPPVVLYLLFLVEWDTKKNGHACNFLHFYTTRKANSGYNEIEGKFSSL